MPPRVGYFAYSWTTNTSGISFSSDTYCIHMTPDGRVEWKLSNRPDDPEADNRSDVSTSEFDSVFT